MQPIRMVSVMAQIFDPLYRAVASWLSGQCAHPIHFVDDVDWRERERLLREGAVEMGFICGLPYVEEADRCPPRLALLGAPVMAAPRYQDRPIYFSDVVVRADAPYQRFDDLAGSRWSYNEPNSHSGCNLTCYTLARRGWRDGFFAEVIEAGAHQASLSLVLDGSVDASSIDSTVLERARDQDPSLHHRLRVIETLGPSPIPPAVVSTRVDARLADALSERLLAMPASLLAPHGVARFVAMADADYDPIRSMGREARDTPMRRR